MSTTLTVRTDESLRKALAERADALGIGISELVRQILQDALDGRALGARTASLRGRLKLPKESGDPLRERLRRRNWRS